MAIASSASDAQPPRQPRQGAILVVLVVICLIAGAALVVQLRRNRPSAAPPITSSSMAPSTSLTSVPPDTPHTELLFDGGQPGSPEATAALIAAARHNVVLINYSFINVSAAASRAYLDQAHRLGARVVISLKDLLPPGSRDLDSDPSDRDEHMRYGATNDERVAAISKAYDRYPAMFGYYTGDELPADDDPADKAGNRARWLGPLKHRYTQLKSLSSKPVLASFYRNSLSFLQAVKPAADVLIMDYYPYPEGPGQSYGSINDISAIAADVHTAAGAQGCFAIQAFSYYKSEPDMIRNFGFPPAVTAYIGTFHY